MSIIGFFAFSLGVIIIYYYYGWVNFIRNFIEKFHLHWHIFQLEHPLN